MDKILPFFDTVVALNPWVQTVLIITLAVVFTVFTIHAMEAWGRRQAGPKAKLALEFQKTQIEELEKRLAERQRRLDYLNEDVERLREWFATSEAEVKALKDAQLKTVT